MALLQSSLKLCSGMKVQMPVSRLHVWRAVVGVKVVVIVVEVFVIVPQTTGLLRPVARAKDELGYPPNCCPYDTAT